jgi:hypothetical protein
VGQAGACASAAGAQSASAAIAATARNVLFMEGMRDLRRRGSEAMVAETVRPYDID